MRFTDYLRTARKAFGRQLGRSVLTIVAMSISATIVMALAAVSLGLADAARGTLTPNNSMREVIITPTRTAATASIFGGAQEVSQGKDTLTNSTLNALRTTPHVASLVPLAEIWEFKSFQIQGSDKTFVAQAAGVGGDLSPLRPLAAGTYPNADSQDYAVVLGSGYAKELGVAPQALIGKTVTITTQNGYIGDGAALLPPNATLRQMQQYAAAPTTLTATVAGVLAAGADDSRMYIPMGWAHLVRSHYSTTLDAAGQPATSQEDQITKDGYSSIIAQADAPEHVQTIVDAAQNLGVGAISTVSQLKKIMQFATVVWVGLGAIALVTLLAGALGIVNTMLTAVAEQQFAIAVWRACGATKGVVVRMFVVQAAVMGAISGVIGAGISVLAANFANAQLASLLAAQNLQVVPVAVTPWWLLLAGASLTMLCAIAAGMYPAWRASSVEPSLVLNNGG